MRKSLLALLLLVCVLAAQSAIAGEIPDMKGTWICEKAIVASLESGIYENASAQSTLVIESQRSRVFTGYKKWTLHGQSFTEKIVGAIAADGEVYIGEEKDGQLLGDFDRENKTLLLFYVESGPEAKVLEGIYKKVQ